MMDHNLVAKHLMISKLKRYNKKLMCNPLKSLTPSMMTIREDLDPQFLSLTGGGGVAMLQLDFHPV